VRGTDDDCDWDDLNREAEVLDTGGSPVLVNAHFDLRALARWIDA
jgi:hypothetical protein